MITSKEICDGCYSPDNLIYKVIPVWELQNDSCNRLKEIPDRVLCNRCIHDFLKCLNIANVRYEVRHPVWEIPVIRRGEAYFLLGHEPEYVETTEYQRDRRPKRMGFIYIEAYNMERRKK